MTERIPTQLEREIILELSNGKLLKQLAWERKRSLHTLYFQVKMLHQAYDTHTPAALVALFLRKGWIT